MYVCMYVCMYLHLSFFKIFYYNGNSFFTVNYWTSSSDAKSPWTRSLDRLPLFTLREIDAFFKDSGKTAKLNKRTKQLLNDTFHEGNFLMFQPFVELAT